MRNTGVELQLSAAVVNKGDFSYNLSLTGAYNDNKFVSFSSDLFKGQTYIDVVGMPAPGSQVLFNVCKKIDALVVLCTQISRSK
jgi:hypothetical protein